ncbi:unnamed protein product [Effrenium voratum]|uniref:Tubulin/FtsZ GTPase domain-containing protein n=1 Tax=Effrenium voratum TaxID=2562239 RepID=A0AA36N399_9DINO|nr:unnamed protein product [Effrenium voratum]
MGNADNDGRDSPGGERLPTQLGRLPSDKLASVQKALEELRDAGLTSVADIEKLAKSVKAADGARIPPDELTTVKMADSMWAWTPKRWSESLAAQPGPAGAPSKDLGNGNGNEGDQLPAVEESVEKNCAIRSKRSEDFKSWYNLMKEAEAQLRSMATMDNSVMTKGDGAGVLFQATASVKGKGALKRMKPERTHWGAKLMAGGSWKNNPAPAIISLHLGDDGSFTGMDCWQHMMAEHGLKDGRPEKDFYGCSNVLFNETKKGRYVPRALFATRGAPETLDAVSSAKIFEPGSLLVGDEPKSDWELACGQDFPELADMLRMQLERADYTEGFLLTHNMGEGIGSSVACSLLRLLSNEHGKKQKFSVACTPDFQAAECKEAHAFAGLNLNQLLENGDLVSLYDWTSLRRVAQKEANGLGIAAPTDWDCRGLVARFVGNVLGPMRFGRLAQDARTGSLLTHCQSLVVYPRVKIVLPSLGGLGKPLEAGRDPGLDAATGAVTGGALCNVTATESKILGCSLTCRGLEQCLALSPVMVQRLNQSSTFASYAGGGFTISSYTDPKSQGKPEAALMTNSTAAFRIIQSYTQGLETCTRGVDWAGLHSFGCYSENMEPLTNLIQDYMNGLSNDTVVCEEDYGVDE